MKVWITKYALTDGIFAVEAKMPDPGERMVAYRLRGAAFDQYAHGEGKDWHRDEASALRRAEQMRIAKIRSHQKAIKRLQELSFQPSDGHE